MSEKVDVREITVDDRYLWYIVQVYSGFEKSVIEQIKNRANLEGCMEDFSELYYPSIEEEVLVYNEVKKKQRTIYPGYIFIKMAMNRKSWGVISDSNRVIGFVGSDKLSPKPMTESEYQEMIKSITEPITVLEDVTFSIGDVVKMKSGSFESLTGNVSSVDKEKKTVSIMLLIFDRETTLELEWSQVEKVKK